MSIAEPTDPSPYRGYRYPPEIIVDAVWLYFRFHFSLRDVEDLLAERGIIVSHESIRQSCAKFGATFAARLRRRRVRAGDKWHLDEVALKIHGKRHWLFQPLPHAGILRLAGRHSGRSVSLRHSHSEGTRATRHVHARRDQTT
jgi:putative transposase